jgi:hypothetical protein
LFFLPYGFPLVIIRQLHIVSIAIFPAETYSELVIHSHAVFPCAISLQRLQAIAARNAQVIQSPCLMQ